MPLPGVGEQFRQFRILAKAGEGSMGVVLHAEDTRLGRAVALKFMVRIGSVDPVAAERARTEARSLAALNHASIVTIYDIDELDGLPYIVMEWVRGQALDDAFRGKPAAPAEFLRIARGVAEALAAAHSRNIVHRDLKPGNVLLTADGAVKLVDFGLATLSDSQQRLTGSATVVGTPAYMSPEQATGGTVTAASDVFSFGVLCYELLAGRLPFAGANVPAMLYAIVNTPHAPLAATRPDLSAGLIGLVERCLQKRPGARFADGAELAREIDAVLAEGAPGSRDPARGRRTLAAPAGRQPEIRYCRTRDGQSIAYAVHGAGPPLVRVLGWFTHLEIDWAWPALRLVWERLAETHAVVRYDGRGIGLSDRWDGEFTEETRQLDLEAVLEAVGARTASLFGISEGAWTAAEYAGRHPERVGCLILYGGYSRGVRIRPGYDAEEERALETLIRKAWGRDTPEIRQIFTTAYFGADADPDLITHFNNLQRAAADGETAARYMNALHSRGDARDFLALVRTPTLVIHCREDRIVPFEEGRRLASLIPGATFLPFPTASHYFPVDDHVTDRLVGAIDRFTR